MSAGVTATASNRPPLSTATWRLRPRIFLPASLGSSPRAGSAPLALRRVALHGLGIDDHQRRAGLAPGPLTVGHNEMMVDPLHVPAVAQEAPIIVADAVRGQVLGQGVPRDAVALNIADAVHDLPKDMHARTPTSLCNG